MTQVLVYVPNRRVAPSIAFWDDGGSLEFVRLNGSSWSRVRAAVATVASKVPEASWADMFDQLARGNVGLGGSYWDLYEVDESQTPEAFAHEVLERSPR